MFWKTALFAVFPSLYTTGQNSFLHNSYFIGLRQTQSMSGSEPDEEVTHLCMKLQYTSNANTTTHQALDLGVIKPLQYSKIEMFCNSV